MRSLRELWRISKPFYMDILLGELSQKSVKSKEKLVKQIKTSAIVNKLILTGMLLIYGIYSASGRVVDVSMFYVLMTFFVTFFFLHTMTAFVSKGFDLLYTLPLSEEEIAKVRLMAFFRIFDLPLVAVLIAFPLAVAWFHGIYTLPMAILCIASVESLSVWLSFKFGKFFYERIMRSTKSIFATLLRLITYLVWSLVFIGIYAVSSLMSLLSKARGFESLVLGFDYIFPFNYGALTIGVFDPKSIATAVPLIALSFLALRRCFSDVVRFELRFVETSGDFEIRVSRPIFAILKKDARVIFRNPGLALLILLPPMQTFIVSIFMKKHGFLSQLILTSIPLALMGMIPFVLMGVEKPEIVEVLPLRKRDLVLSKVLFGCAVYAVSISPIVPKTLLPLALIPAVFSAFTISCIMLDRIGTTRNVYAGLDKVLLLILVFYFLTMFPLSAGLVAEFLGRNPFVAVITLASVEMAVAVLLLSTIGI